MNEYKAKVASFFKNLDGDDFILTSGQQRIFQIVYEPHIRRGVIKATTQYGKSEIASMALVTAAYERKEKILIVSPSIKQSSIIMGKVIEHLFDHPHLIGMIEYFGKMEQLKSERSKSRITMRNDSEIKILTAEAHTVAKESKSLMGFGATIVLVDESALIPDILFSKILRMVGGVKDGKLIQLGNPFEMNHFGRAFNMPRYENVSIDYHQALAEGRITQEFLDEAREDMPEMDWEVFYECKFPSAGPSDALIPRDWIEGAVNQKGCHGEHKQAGLDVARFGNDKTAYVYREGGEVKRLEVCDKMDGMEVVGWTRGFLEQDEPEILTVDVIGVGAGVNDRLEELSDEQQIDSEVYGVNVGSSPSSDEYKEKFFNLRAEVHWNLRNLFKPDKNGKSSISIPDDPQLKKELGEIRYKYSSERKIKIEAKEEMKKRIGNSPDKADALGLAFFDVMGSAPDMIIV